MNNPAIIRRAFTLIELLVSVAILVVIILGVAIMFRSTGASVGLSQASMEMLSNVRAFEQQFDRDIQHIDRNGFMIIRQQYWTANAEEFDQISFTATGTYPHKTGTTTATPLSDGYSANAALIWWGHLVFTTPSIPTGYTSNHVSQSDSAYQSSSLLSDDTLANNAIPAPTAPPSATPCPAGFYAPASSGPTSQWPGAFFNTVVLQNGANTVLSQSYVLGRHATLLAPNNGSGAVGPAGAPCAAYPTAAFASNAQPTSPNIAPNILANTTDGGSWAHITSGRTDALAQTPAQLMQEFWTAPASAITNYCYRFKSVRTVNDDTNSSMAAGAFRMHDQMLQGCSHFEIRWTDGSQDNTSTAGIGSNRGNCYWFGTGLVYPAGGFDTSVVANDRYDVRFPVATSGVANFPAGSWPKALQITIWVTDPNDRLKGGRKFIQYVHLPN